MSKRLAYGLILFALIVGGIVGGLIGVFTFIRIVGGSGEPSVTISAPTISLADLSPVYTQTADLIQTEIAQLDANVAQVATQVERLAQAVDNAPLETQIAQISVQVSRLGDVPQIAQPVTVTRTPRPTATPLPTRTPTLSPTPTETALPNQILFRIVPQESEARFIVDELKPYIIGLIGSTNQVAGDIFVDFDNPVNSRVGVIRINLRTLRTDDPMRDGTIRAEILRSSQPEYEFADFSPTVIEGLPSSITFGQAVTFRVTGNLPLRGIIRSVTFDVTVTPVSETQIEGLATTTILRADYDLMQEGLLLHGVSEEVRLELEFVAQAVEQ